MGEGAGATAEETRPLVSETPQPSGAPNDDATSEPSQKTVHSRKSTVSKVKAYITEKPRHLTPLKKGSCLRITPLVLTTERGSGRVIFDARCALVLVALGHDLAWDGSMTLDERDMRVVLRKIEESAEPDKFNTVNVEARKSVHRDRITEAMINSFAEKNTEFVKTHMPFGLHGILVKDIVHTAFEMFDKDGDRELDRVEWEEFLEVLEAKHFQHLLHTAFQVFRAFFGRGQPWWPEDTRMVEAEHLKIASGLADVAASSPSGALVPPERRRFQWGRDPDNSKGGGRVPVLPPGWWEDLCYYSANNHPLHGIFSCDNQHRLSRFERIMMELATIAFTFFTNGLKTKWVENDDHSAPFEFLHDAMIFSLVVVTVPSIMMWWSLFLLYTCPCGHVDKSVASDSEVQRASRRSNCAEVMAHIIIVLNFTMLGFRIYRATETSLHNLHIRTTLRARLQSYVVSWMMMTGIYFNPLIAWGNPEPPGKGAICIGDYIGLGQWRIEKQKFQASCVVAMEKLLTKEHSSLGPIVDEEVITPVLGGHWGPGACMNLFRCFSKSACGTGRVLQRQRPEEPIPP